MFLIIYIVKTYADSGSITNLTWTLGNVQCAYHQITAFVDASVTSRCDVKAPLEYFVGNIKIYTQRII